MSGFVALGGSEHRVTRVLRLLDRALRRQILPDGGHRTRSPSVQLEVLRDLIDIRSALRTARIEPPPALRNTIEAMAPVLRLFRHGDRRLALFNNSVEEDGVLIDLVLSGDNAVVIGMAARPLPRRQRRMTFTIQSQLMATWRPRTARVPSATRECRSRQSFTSLDAIPSAGSTKRETTIPEKIVNTDPPKST